MKTKLLLSCLLAGGLAVAQGQVYTTPVGYNTIPCPPGSDTYVGASLLSEVGLTVTLSGDAVEDSGFADLPLTFGGMTEDEYAETHYVRVLSGAKTGSWYEVVANDSDSLTVDLAGDSAVGLSSGDSVAVIRFWTLASLFDPALSTTDPETTGNAIVASPGFQPVQQRTQVLIPNIAGTGINLSPSQVFYLFNGAWRLNGVAPNISFDDQVITPDAYFVIRQPATVTVGTLFVASGQVEMDDTTFVLSTNESQRQDNYIALLRPIDVELDDLGLGGTAAFLSSPGFQPAQQTDQLLVFDNAVAAINKSPSAVYYYFNGAWRQNGFSPALDFGGDVVPAGGGFIIRKAATATGESVFWVNSPTY